MKRWPYLALFFANAVVAALLATYGQDLLQKSPAIGHCDVRANAHCLGQQTIYRASATIAVFFLVLMLLSGLYEHRAFRSRLVLGCQLPVYLGALTGAFFLPNEVFDAYAYIAAVLSGLFILMQIVILLDCVYHVRDSLLNRMQDPKAPRSWLWPCVYLGLSVTGLGLAVLGLVVLFYYYAASPLGLGFLIGTCVSILVVVLLSVADRVGAGLLPPAAIALYLVYLLWQTLLLLPDVEPAFLQGGSRASTISIPSTIIAALTVSYTGWRTSCAASSIFRLELPEAPTETALDPVCAEAGRRVVDIEPQIMAPSWQFHCIMLFSGLYMAMALTNWGVGTGESDTQRVSMWVQIASQWATTLLFTWTLLAPLVLPDRDFS
ncbi:hypothetical protein SDRG_10781 [Saprolegnia diclina VS20]|uniref:Serine incorporator n=1 Tax=Saprolegnia diclina (strain VS20) TaxID=1156394 RepID=T0Q1A1_SAPDV|nr:hypothetical protein SDRG_10781 [Saprolegnia diclina VS20]EQC31614.1 hypothetical protein SDRG_10781 [Saprolegnia diclina VS20]|eukprot:XP_008615013.1 hypothetical protein SDRG_10781 [Saprolegnia diclina VS20]